MLPLLATAIPAAFQIGSGIAQYLQGSNMNVVRPEYKKPSAISEMTANARQMALSNRMAGQSLAEANINRSTANLFQNAKNASTGSAGLMTTLLAGQQQENSAMNDLAAKSAQFQLQNKAALQNQLQTEAQYADKEWEWNKKQKYLDDAATKSALMGAGMQNIQGALNTAGQGLTSSTMSGLFDKMFAKRQERKDTQNANNFFETMKSMQQSGINPFMPMG